MTVQEGGCLCGAVRFRVEGEPLFAGACFCRDCQYTSGGAEAYGLAYPAGALKVTAGETRRYFCKGDSGAEVRREFCPDCGVHLFSGNSRHPEMVAIKTGVFDDPGWFRSQGSIWTASAQPWHRVDPELPSWPKDPVIEV